MTNLFTKSWINYRRKFKEEKTPNKKDLHLQYHTTLKPDRVNKDRITITRSPPTEIKSKQPENNLTAKAKPSHLIILLDQKMLLY